MRSSAPVGATRLQSKAEQRAPLILARRQFTRCSVQGRVSSHSRFWLLTSQPFSLSSHYRSLHFMIFLGWVGWHKIHIFKGLLTFNFEFSDKSQFSVLWFFLVWSGRRQNERGLLVTLPLDLAPGETFWTSLQWPFLTFHSNSWISCESCCIFNERVDWPIGASWIFCVVYTPCWGKNPNNPRFSSELLWVGLAIVVLICIWHRNTFSNFSRSQPFFLNTIQLNLTETTEKKTLCMLGNWICRRWCWQPSESDYEES